MLEERRNLIQLVDHSEDGWEMVDEYLADNPVYDSSDDKKNAQSGKGQQT